eukprot:m.90524 g.90524  ORF g.90524 m.90524 type:complete len:180 (-) comp18170_c0_seq2:76-615(-)
MTTGCHMMLGYTFITPYVPIIIMGFAYSILACALWPMVAFIIPEHQLGTAYGFMQAVQNLGLAVISMVSGMLVDQKGYLWLEVFFAACLLLALMASVLLYLVDLANGGVLNLPPKAREKLQNDAEKEAKLAEIKEPAPDVRPRTPFDIRNRYISRLGMTLPPAYAMNKRTQFTGPSVLK